MRIVEKTWESKVTGLRFGEVNFDSPDENNIDEVYSSLENEIKNFDFIVARIKTKFSNKALEFPETYIENIKKMDPNFNPLSDFGFKFQDVQVFFSVEKRSKLFAEPLDTSKWSDIIFKQKLDESEINFLLNFLPNKFRFSWYFKEIPEIAEKIYRKWIEEIILSDDGIYVFASNKYDSSKFGFFGAKNVELSARFPLMFSYGIPSFLIVKKFGQILRENGFKDIEIKISLLHNKKFAILYKNSITNAKSHIEIIMSKKNF
jgi:hypothetical protein